MKHHDFTDTLKESLGGRSRTERKVPVKRNADRGSDSADIKKASPDTVKDEVKDEPTNSRSLKDESTEKEPSQEDLTDRKSKAGSADKSTETAVKEIPDITKIVVEEDDSAARKLERKKPGRKKMDASKKKVQITLTVKHETLDELMQVRGYKQKLSWYFDDNVEMLKEAIKNL